MQPFRLWQNFSVRILEGLQQIFVMSKNLGKWTGLERKHSTFQEHDCKLTQEIIELIDREADLLMRGVKETNLDGLRRRISTLFLQYIKTPTFNPEAAQLLKVCTVRLVLVVTSSRHATSAIKVLNFQTSTNFIVNTLKLKHRGSHDVIVNRADPDQIAPLGEAWPRSALVAQTCLSKILRSLW